MLALSRYLMFLFNFGFIPTLLLTYTGNMHPLSQEKFQCVKSVSPSKSMSAVLYMALLKILQFSFRLQLITSRLKYSIFQKEVTWRQTSVNCCFHIFFTLMQNKATNGSLKLKRRVLKGRRPSGKRRRPLPNLWHEWNKWMKENENGWGVISGRQCETSANYYEWETAAELMKKKKKQKKELTFFIRHPRIINRAQAFWWGWRKPQDTWLTSHHRRGRWNTQRGKIEAKKEEGVLLRGTKLNS